MSEIQQTVIDTHSHFLPTPAIDAALEGRVWNGIQMGRDAESGRFFSKTGDLRAQLPWPTPLETAEARLETLRTRRIDRQMTSLSPTMYWYGLPADQGRGVARDSNDDLAARVSEHGQAYIGLGHLPLQDPAAAVDELERCVRDHKFPGVMVGTHVDGRDWDDQALFPVLQAAEQLGALVYFHPSEVRARGWLNDYHLRNLIGNPLETSAAIARLIFGGVFERLPKLVTCFAHAGGLGVLGAGRWDHGYKVRPEAKANIDKLPSDYLKSGNLYFDSITHSPETLRWIMDRVGVGQMVLGTDYPADMGEGFPVDFIESCDQLSDEEKRAVLGGNVERMLAGLGPK